MDRIEFQRMLSDLAIGLSEHKTTFSALGDPTRQAILIQLLNHYGGMRVNEIAEAIGLSRPATSHHLKTLREAGLVDMYENGTKNFYHVCSSAAEWRSIAALASSASFVAEIAAQRDEAEIEHAEREA